MDSAPVSFDSRKALALLAYLAAHPGPHTRAELALLLWPESDTTRARGALRYTLHAVKRATGDDWLDVTRTHVALPEAAGLAVDLHAFRAAQAAATDTATDMATDETGPAAPDRAAIDRLARAAALYRDDFLAGFTLRDSANFDEWQFFQTEQWRQRLIDVLTRLARLHAARQEYGPAIAAAQRLAGLDPLREDVHRDLLEMLLASGQRAAAHRLYAAYAARLEAELGVAPGAAMQALLHAPGVHVSGDRASATDETAQDDTALGSATVSEGTPAQPRPHNLRTPAGGFVGRKTEQRALVAQLLDDECRLLTLVGPGGMGKTRLAQQVAHNLRHAPAPHFADGLFYVALTGVTEQSALVAAVAGALTFAFSGVKPPLEQLQNFLAAKRCLIVLDNFEQLAPVASVLADLLSAAPGLTLLVTSRARLHLYEEWLYAVDALDVPPPEMDPAAADVATLLGYSAVELFYQRARRTNPRFDLAAAAPDVVRICRLVHGMPLALELAAGWTRLLPCAEIADQIAARLDFLATEMRDVPARHRSLRATFAYSWQRLAAEERTVFARLAVFRGGFDYAAAKNVAGASHLVLARLIDQTMVQRVRLATAFADRLTIHEMLRQYAWDELSPAAQHDVQAAHARHFARRLAQLTPQRYRAAETEALAAINDDIDNVLAAWHWLVAQVEDAPTSDVVAALADAAPTSDIVAALADAAPMLACFLIRRARFGEGEQLFARAVSAVDRARAAAHPQSAPLADGLTGLRARLQLGQAEHLFNLSNFPRVAALTDVAAPVLQATGDMAGYAEALWLAGTARVRMGATDAAETLLRQSLDAFSAAGADTAAMLAHNGLGICFSNQGRYAEARTHYEAYLTRARAAGYVRGMANALNNLGSNYARDGDYVRAHELYRESHELALETGEQLVIAVTLSNLGAVSRALHDYAAACDFYQRSLAITRTIGERRWTAANLNGLGLVWVDRGDDPAATALLLEGLATALAINSIPDALDALATIAPIIARHGAPALARTLLCGVLSHARTMSSARARAREHLDELGHVEPCPPVVASDADPALALAAQAQAYCRTRMGMRLSPH